MTFMYHPVLKIKQDTTSYRLLSQDFISIKEIEGKEFLIIKKEALTLLAENALKDVSFYLRTKHLQSLEKIVTDPESSDNDRFVAINLLKNAVIAKDGVLPGCQDTGTAIILGKKGQNVWTSGDDKQTLSQGVYQAYKNNNLRYSQIFPLSMFEERNTGTNLPAQIDLYAEQGNEYHFLFLAKGGGSANKTFLYQQTKSLLNEDSLTKFIQSHITDLGTSACPPYHLALVIGGTSAEDTLKTVKLASAGYLDHLPFQPGNNSLGYRDLEWETKVEEIAQQTDIGAQFGGKHLVHDVRVIRLPRHAASCPVGLGVSCSADRNIKGKITKDGIFLEQLETNPEQYLSKAKLPIKPPVTINLDRPMSNILKELSQHPIRTRLLLSGTLIVARDAAHAKIQELLNEGKPMPEYFCNHPIYYAGPAKTPKGMASGSFGPTTAGRMDSYVDSFMQQQGSMIMLAKGNRSQQVQNACQKYGGFYLGSIGGPAAILAKENILSVELIAFEELGMEAIRKIKVKDFPAFIITDNKGHDFFAEL